MTIASARHAGGSLHENLCRDITHAFISHRLCPMTRSTLTRVTSCISQATRACTVLGRSSDLALSRQAEVQSAGSVWNEWFQKDCQKKEVLEGIEPPFLGGLVSEASEEAGPLRTECTSRYTTEPLDWQRADDIRPPRIQRGAERRR